MKSVLFLCLFLSSLLSAGALEHVSIGDTEFILTTESYDLYDSKGKTMKLYKEENNNERTFLLSLVLEDRTGGCSDKSIQEGAYEINGTRLTLYRFWDRVLAPDTFGHPARVYVDSAPVSMWTPCRSTYGQLSL